MLARGLLGLDETIVELALEQGRNVSSAAGISYCFLTTPTLWNSSSCRSQSIADVLLGLGQCFEHPLFGHFAGKTLDHQHRFAAAGDDQVEIALFQLVLRREGDELAVDMSQADRAQGAQKRQWRQAQGGASAVHAQHVAVVLLVAGDDEALNLHFVVKPVGKERPNGPVHEPRGQGFLGRRPAFALEKSAGKLAGRGRALAVIAGQREEVDASPRGAGGRGGQDDRLAILDQATTGGLLG